MNLFLSKRLRQIELIDILRWCSFTNECLWVWWQGIQAHVENVRHRRRVPSGDWDGARLQTSALGYGGRGFRHTLKTCAIVGVCYQVCVVGVVGMALVYKRVPLGMVMGIQAHVENVRHRRWVPSGFCNFFAKIERLYFDKTIHYFRMYI